MRKIVLSVLCLALLSFIFDAHAQSRTKSQLLQVSVKGKKGFINRNGKIVIKPKFEGVGDFSEGLAVATIFKGLPGEYGFIDESGDWVVPPQFYIAWSFSEGLARFIPKEGAVSRSKHGFIDRTGKVVIEPKFERVEDFLKDWRA